MPKAPPRERWARNGAPAALAFVAIAALALFPGCAASSCNRYAAPHGGPSALEAADRGMDSLQEYLDKLDRCAENAVY